MTRKWIRFTDTESWVRKQAAKVIDDATSTAAERKDAQRAFDEMTEMATQRLIDRRQADSPSKSEGTSEKSPSKRQCPVCRGTGQLELPHIPNGMSSEKVHDARAKEFLDKVRSAGSGGVRIETSPRVTSPVAAKPKVIPSLEVSPPRALLTSPDVEKYCEVCEAPFDVCHCDKPQPTPAALLSQAAAEDKSDESRDDLTVCPLCLVQRRFCGHSGRAQGAAQ